MTDLAGVVLAAGAARRFGAPKLLHPLPDGSPIGVAAARTLARAVPATVVVVAAGDRALIRACAAAGLEVVQNPRADAGMGTSLAAGVSATAAAGGWLIALADMPWVGLETVRTLADRLRDGASLVAPVCGGRRGHPVGFAAHWRDQLTTLSGDAGARRLLAEHAAELVLEPTDDVGVLTDVDYPGDLACRR